MSRRLALLSWLLLIAPGPLLAGDHPWSPRRCVALAELIVRARVDAVDGRVVEVTRDHLSKAYEAKLTVQEVLKGALGSADKRLVVHYTRHIGTRSPFPEVALRAGKEYLLYLKADRKGHLGLISPYFGAARATVGLAEELRALIGPARPPRAPTTRPRQPAPRPPGPRLDTARRTAPKAGPVARVSAPALKVPPPTPPAAVAGLLGLAKLERPRVTAGAPVRLWLILRNAGTRPLELYFQHLERFVTVEIYRTGPTAKRLAPRDPDISPDPPRKSAFVGLVPGSYVYTAIDLTGRCALPPGRYQARLRLQLPALYAGGELGLKAWAGTLASGWVTLEVVAKATPKATPKAPEIRPGTCDQTHLGALEAGRCRRCKTETGSRDQAVCVFCADELGVCPFCVRRKAR